MFCFFPSTWLSRLISCNSQEHSFSILVSVFTALLVVSSEHFYVVASCLNHPSLSLSTLTNQRCPSGPYSSSTSFTWPSWSFQPILTFFFFLWNLSKYVFVLPFDHTWLHIITWVCVYVSQWFEICWRKGNSQLYFLNIYSNTGHIHTQYILIK